MLSDPQSTFVIANGVSARILLLATLNRVSPTSGALDLKRTPIQIMSSHGVDTSKQISPQRPGYQLSRSISEASPPLKHHRHQNHLHQRRHQDRNSDRLPQAAVLALQMPLRGSLDLPRSEGVTPYLLSSAEQSRRASMLPPGAEEIGPLALAQAAASNE